MEVAEVLVAVRFCGTEGEVVSVVLNEYKEVLRRDFDYEHEKISEYINRILSFSELVEPVEKINYIIEDPDDNIILECAVEAQADYIVTYDKHLLRLIVFRNIKILTPESLAGIIK